MKDGDLDRRVRIFDRADTPDPDYGTGEGAWLPIGECWAQVQDMLPSRADRIDAAVIDLTSRPARVRMRWRDDIAVGMRIVDIADKRTMRVISGPAMIGRREYIELMAEDIDGETTQGEDP